MIMGYVCDTAFLSGQKKQQQRNKTISVGLMGDAAFFARAKNPYHHIRSTAVWSFTPHTISNRHTCQKENCMIDRL